MKASEAIAIAKAAREPRKLAYKVRLVTDVVERFAKAGDRWAFVPRLDDETVSELTKLGYEISPQYFDIVKDDSGRHQVSTHKVSW